jgi:predicted lysophospholipase L1 biosynthesis ABC-type transport system permease subunit
MGYRDRHIALLVILEAAIPTFLAAVTGGALAWAVDALVARLTLTGVIEMPELRATAVDFGWALAAALLIALLTAVAPLYRLRRMNVAAVITCR